MLGRTSALVPSTHADDSRTARGPARRLGTVAGSAIDGTHRLVRAYNLLRLIHLATGWLRTGAPVFEVTGEVRARLLDIKEGRVPLDDELREAEALTPELEAARDVSKLPAAPDRLTAHHLLQRVNEERARRWMARAPGPWGDGAPVAPTPG